MEQEVSTLQKKVMFFCTQWVNCQTHPIGSIACIVIQQVELRKKHHHQMHTMWCEFWNLHVINIKQENQTSNSIVDDLKDSNDEKEWIISYFAFVFVLDGKLVIINVF